MNDYLFEKLRIAFRYGMKVMKSHPDETKCIDIYFDKAIAVINRIYPKNKKK